MNKNIESGLKRVELQFKNINNKGIKCFVYILISNEDWNSVLKKVFNFLCKIIEKFKENKTSLLLANDLNFRRILK